MRFGLPLVMVLIVVTGGCQQKAPAPQPEAEQAPPAIAHEQAPPQPPPKIRPVVPGVRRAGQALPALVQFPTETPPPTLREVDQMKARLRAALPAGTPISAVQCFMECEGFCCEMLKNQSFSEEGTVHSGIDYLYCDRKEPAAFLITRRWQVAIVVRKGAVWDIFVSMGLIGP